MELPSEPVPEEVGIANEERLELPILVLVVDTLADIQSCHKLSSASYMDHNLTCVHSRTAADCDDAVFARRSECELHLKSLPKGWIWSNIQNEEEQCPENPGSPRQSW